MEKIILVIPDKKYEGKAKEYIQEFLNNNSQIHGVGELDESIDNYDMWLKRVDDYSNGRNLKEGHVSANTYFAVSEDTDKLIGMIDIRHKLNDYLLKEGGHIGYCVRPSERKKGYATKILYLGLEKCAELGIDKVLITCDKSNIGSAKTIQNNFGILENEIQCSDLKELLQRYWIDVNYALENIRKNSKKI